MESMNEGNNILDELNNEKYKFTQQKLDLKDSLKNVISQLSEQNLS